ncbi:MAG: DUF4249 family protein [Ferruginibacter sp.]
MSQTTLPYHTLLVWRSYKQTVIFFILFISLVSCKKTFNSSQFTDDKLVVLAEITAGDSMEIPIGKTIKVGNGGLIRFEKVSNATVTVIDDAAHSFNLVPNWSAQFAANPTTMFTNHRQYKGNTTYSIEINHPTLGLVTASTHIPSIPMLISLDTAADRYQERNVLAADITWRDEGNTDPYYIIEALKETVLINRYFYYLGIKYNYDAGANRTLFDRIKNSPGVKLLRDTIPQNLFTRINIYTADNITENSRINNLDHPFRRIFIPWRNLIGDVFTTKVYIDREFFKAPEVNQKGRVRLQLKSVNKELYDYLLVYEKYKTDFGSVPSSQLVSPSGNVKNGLGIFGGSAKKEHIFYFDAF